MTALLFFTGILPLISQKLRFVHYVQCRRLRTPKRLRRAEKHGGRGRISFLSEEGRRIAFFTHLRPSTTLGHHWPTGGAAGGAAAARRNARADGARAHGEVAPAKVIFRLAAKVRGLTLEPPLHTLPDTPPLPSRHGIHAHSLQRSAQRVACIDCSSRALPCGQGHLRDDLRLLGLRAGRRAPAGRGSRSSSPSRSSRRCASAQRKKTSASAQSGACVGPACVHVRCTVRSVRGATLVPACCRDNPPWMYMSVRCRRVSVPNVLGDCAIIYK